MRLTSTRNVALLNYPNETSINFKLNQVFVSKSRVPRQLTRMLFILLISDAQVAGRVLGDSAGTVNGAPVVVVGSDTIVEASIAWVRWLMP